jgi:predicted flap endonuclease-1-like 5' DNA nuclease
MGADYIQLMAILQKLKSLLGFDDSGSERGSSQEVGVTVERERSGVSDDETPNVDDEETAVAETDAAASTDSMTEPSGAPHKPAEPAEATGPTQADAAPTEEKEPGEGVDVLEPDADAEDLEDETEPSETAVDEPTDAADEADETQAEAAADTDTDDDAESEAEAEDVDTGAGDEPDDELSEPVDVIKGIGPAYADRMADAGVETVADLAEADAAELESETDISEKRIQGWIDRAKVR